MSIAPILAKLVAQTRLISLPSLFTGADTARVLYVTPDVFAAVSPPFADDETGRRLAEFRAWLDAFLEGGEISVAEDPRRKPPDAMLARVAPVEEEFWSLRVDRAGRDLGYQGAGRSRREG